MKNKFRFTKEQNEWISLNCRNYSNKDLAEKFNKKFNTNLTTTQMGQHKYVLRLTGRQEKYNNEQIEWLKQNVTKYSVKELTEKFNTQFGTHHKKKGLYIKILRLGLKIEVGARPRHSAGDEVERKDGYIYIKIAETNEWVPKQKYIYEQYYGEIPDGFKVTFLDRDRTNFDINNLYLIDEKTLTIASTRKLITDNAELTKTGLLLAEMMKKVANKKRNINRKE